MGRIRSLGRLLAPLDFSFLYQSFFFSLDSFQQNRCWLIVGVLRHKFSMYRKVEYLLT